MASIGLSEQEAKKLLLEERFAGKVDIAAVNSPDNVTISGNAEQIQQIVDILVAKGTFATVLRTDRAYHSHHMKPVAQKMLKLLKDLKPQTGNIPMISSVTGNLVKGTDMDGSYWARNLSSTVRFCDAVQQASKEYHFNALVEVGPHPALAGPIRQSLTALSPQVPPILPTILRKEAEYHRMLLTAISLYDVGVKVSWEAVLHNPEKGMNPKVLQDLPHLPWQRKQYWFDSAATRKKRFPQKTHELLGPRTGHAYGAWINSLQLDALPYLKEHGVQGAVVFPAAGYVAMIIAASGAAKSVLVHDIILKSAIVFNNEGFVKTQISLTSAVVSGVGTPAVISSENSKGEWQEHAEGKFVVQAEVVDEQKQTKENVKLFDSLKERCTQYVSKEECYTFFTSLGLEYGPIFQGISSMWKGDKEVMAHLTPASCVTSGSGLSYLLHPSLLDALFQVLIGAAPSLEDTFLPVRLGKVIVHHPCHFTSHYVAHGILNHFSSASISGNLDLYTPDGILCASVKELECNAIGGGKKKSLSSADHGEASRYKWDNSLLEISWNMDPYLNKNWKALVPFEHYPSPLGSLPDNIFILVCHNAVKALESAGKKPLPKHQRLYDYMKELVADREKKNLPLPQVEIPEEKTATNAELVIIARVAKSMEGILLGTIDPLGVLFGDEAMYSFYEQATYAVSANLNLKRAIKLFASKNCYVKVLEIGAGTGGTTGYAFSGLGDHLSSYTYTDISPAYFAKAKAKFASHASQMIYSVLNIEQDPISQGYEPHSYDILIATDVIHATVDVVVALQNAMKLLRPGGVLIMNEFVNCPISVHALFGTLDGWWRFHDPQRRHLGATLNDKGWREAFLEAGAGDVYVLPDDEENPIHVSFVIYNNAEEKKKKDLAGEAVWYVVPDEAGLAQEIFKSLPAGSCHIVNKVEEIPDAAHVLFLADYGQQHFLFNGFTEKSLNDLQSITNKAQRLVWVSKGACAVNGVVKIPQKSLAIGLLRSLRSELPSLQIPFIDLDPDASLSTNFNSLIDLLSLLSAYSPYIIHEHEIAVRNGNVYTARLQTKKPEGWREIRRERKVVKESEMRLNVGSKGLLTTLHWKESERREPAENEVEIQVQYAGINFVDVTSVVSTSGTDLTAGDGLECAGIITKIGSKVDPSLFHVGERVAAFARNSFGTFTYANSKGVIRLPDSIPSEVAVQIPISFWIAFYGLHELARIQQGEKVLIHCGAGGVGQAAVQISQLLGCEVFTTVGSEEKREFLQREYGIPADHIMSSRNLEFVEQVKTITKGEGVDVVLNSLGGDAQIRSFSLLAPFGRFVEVGKGDISPQNIGSLLGQTSFFIVDAKRILERKPELGHKIYQQIIALFLEGKLRPIPSKLFSASKAEEAFRFLQEGKNIGKVVLHLKPEENVEVERPPLELKLNGEYVYVLVGGLGGFGRAVATWMASKGCRKLVFMSRSGATSPAAAKLIAELSGTYANLKLKVYSVDVTQYEQVEAAIQQTKKDFDNARIAGIMQMAMVLEDTMFTKMTTDAFNKVLRPKVQGTDHLERAFAFCEPLDFFVIFSSFTSLVGNVGQSNYATAGTYIDHVAFRRQSEGLKAISINWGVIGEIGYVAEREGLTESLKKRGMYAIPLKDSMDALEYCMLHPEIAQVGIAPTNWKVCADFMPVVNSPMMSFIRKWEEKYIEANSSSNTSTSSGVSILQAFEVASVEEKPTLVKKYLQEKLGSMFGVAADDIDTSRRIVELGVDSLMAIEIKNWVGKDLRAEVSVLDLTSGKSIDELTVKIISFSKASAAPAATKKAGEFVCARPVTSPAVRLLCFPFVGAPADSFQSWHSHLDARVEMWTAEPYSTPDWDPLLEKIEKSVELIVKGDTTTPLVLYGHSLGAFVAYEVALRLQNSKEGKFPPVKALIVGASGSPSLPGTFDHKAAQHTDEDVIRLAKEPEKFLSMMIQLGIVENTSLGHEVLLQQGLLGRRYTRWYTQLPRSEESKVISVPLVAIHSSTDKAVTNREVVHAWQKYSPHFQYKELDGGGHTFMVGLAENVVKIVNHTIFG